MKLSRRAFITGVGAAIAAGLGGGWMATRKGSLWGGKRPHIVLLIADDLRFDALGFMGDPIVKTPFLDALAPECFIGKNNYVTTSICWSSRASIMTGAYYRKHRVYANKPLPTQYGAEIFPVLLKNNGYRTGFIGKWGFEPSAETAFHTWHNIGDGAKYEVGEDQDKRHLTDDLTMRAQEFIAQPGEEPMLLIVSYKAPHGPYDVGNRFEELYKDVEIPRKPTDRPDFIELLPQQLKEGPTRANYEKNFTSEAEYQRIRKNYYGLVSGVDDSVQKIVTALKESNKWDDTLFIFTSDNGLMLGDHGLFGKTCMYEESICTPLLMRLPKNHFPEIVPNKLKALTLNVDICPTILSAADIPWPDHVQGEDLLSYIVNPEQKWRTGYYYEHPRNGGTISEGYLQSGKWKYVRYASRYGATEEQLFNLRDDPNELSNLAGNPEHERMRKRLSKLMKVERKRLNRA